VRKTVVHECAGLWLDVVRRQRIPSWSFWSAPAWFVQGTEEYLAITAQPDPESYFADCERLGGDGADATCWCRCWTAASRVSRRRSGA
jgi:hypothetical protein